MASIDGGNIIPDTPATGANAITDPTGGAPNFNIEQVFQSFGYTPSQAEIDALAPAFEGRTNVGQTGTSAVAEYVQAHQQLGAAQSLIQGNLMDEQQAAQAQQTLQGVLETSGQEAYQAAANVFTQAPQLFGSLTADQINQYLQPAMNAFQQAQGSAEGAAASRGLGGSSIEGNLIGQNLTQFMQSVLSQGLGIGMTQQQNEASALQAKGAAQISAGENAGQLGAQYSNLANQSAGQNYTAASGISGLAGTAVNQSIAQQAAIKALNPTTQSFGQQVLSGLESAGVQDVTNLGQNLVSGLTGGATSPGGSIPGLSSLTGVSPTGASTGGGVSPTGQTLGSMGAVGSTLLPPSLSLNPVGGLGAGGGL